MTTTTTPSSSSDANNPQPLLDALAPVLQKLAPEQAPLLLAALERMAADKYRAWADQTQDPVEKKGLLDCADREEAISEFRETHGSGPIAAQFEALALGEEANSKFLSVLVESI
mgnify:CR=1 FL=1